MSQPGKPSNPAASPGEAPSEQAPRAYSYLRFSTPEQMRGDSFRRQTELADTYARQRGLELDRSLTLQDLGVSAFKSENAATGALRRFLDAVEQGLVPAGSYLLVESLDRLSRAQITPALTLFMQIIQGGITLITLADQRAYSVDSINSNPTDLIYSILIMMRANEESATKSRRLKSVWDAKRARGTGILTKRSPAWLRPKSDGSGFEAIEERAALVRRFFAMTLEGKGCAGIAVAFNLEGIPTWGDSTRKRAKHWGASYIRKTLRNPAVIGTLVPHETVKADGKRKQRRPIMGCEPRLGYYPSVVPQEVYDLVQARSEGRKSQPRGRHADSPVRNILAGLAHCPKCDDTMTRVMKGSSKKAGYPYLVCSKAKAGAGCDYKAIRLDRIEAAMKKVADSVFTDALPKEQVSPGLTERRESYHQRWAELELQIEEMREEMRVGTASRSKILREELVHLETEQDQQAKWIAEVTAQIELARGPFLKKRLLLLSKELKSGDVERANRELRRTLKEVVVRYDDEALQLRWRHGVETEVSYGTPPKLTLQLPTA